MEVIVLSIHLLVCICLIGLVLLQAKNSGVGSMFGGDSSLHTTRRGLDRTLFNLTIVVSVLFFLVCMATVLFL